MKTKVVIWPSLTVAERGRRVEIVVNGRSRKATEGATLSDLLDELGLGGRNAAVELNRQIVKRPDYPSTALREGDRLEIVMIEGVSKHYED